MVVTADVVVMVVVVASNHSTLSNLFVVSISPLIPPLGRCYSFALPAMVQQQNPNKYGN